MVEQLLSEVGVVATPEMPTRETCGAWLMLRTEVIALVEARKRLANNRAAAEAGGNPEGRGKRAHKGKVWRPAACLCCSPKTRRITGSREWQPADRSPMRDLCRDRGSL